MGRIWVSEMRYLFIDAIVLGLPIAGALYDIWQRMQ